MKRVLLFAGPTISHERVRALIPAAEVYPPVAAGDLIRVALAAGDLVAIIDGFFYQSASVRHKEILELLSRGVRVWGAASMGALRAAELVSFGMRGFGQIFEAYRCGEIEGDDEVAVLHAPEDMGYTSYTEALVNIRYACQRAVESGKLSDAGRQAIIEVAASLPFYERTYQHILKLALSHRLPQEEADIFLTFLREEHLDRKQEDALELLQAVSSHTLEESHCSFEWHETSFFQSWRISEQGTRTDDDDWIFEIDVLTAFQLFDEQYPEKQYHILLKSLATLAANFFQTTPPSSTSHLTELVAHYLAARCNLSLEQELPPSIQRWLYAREQTLSRQEQLARAAIRVWFDPRGPDWRGAIIEHMKTSGLCQRFLTLVTAARTFNKELWGQDAAARCLSLRSELVCAWFQQAWQATEDEFPLALLDRGFQDTADFFKRACFFYAFDKYIGVKQVGRKGSFYHG